MLWAQFTQAPRSASCFVAVRRLLLWPQRDPSQDGARSDQYCAFPQPLATVSLSCSVRCRIGAGAK